MLNLPIKIAPENIPDESFRRILSDFTETEVPLVIWGGSVRDLIFSMIHPSRYTLKELINDLDIAVILKSNIKTEKVEYRDFGEPLRLLPIMKTSLSGLCQKWGKKPEEFGYIDNVTITGISYPVGIMGLRTVYDIDGNLYPDCFALDNGKTFNAVPACLSINSFAIDGIGNLFGPTRYFSDFKNRKARMLRPPQVNDYALPLILRLIDYIRRFNLTLEQKTESIFRQHMNDLATSVNVLEASLDESWTQRLLKKEFGDEIQNASPSKVVEAVFDRCRYLLSYTVKSN